MKTLMLTLLVLIFGVSTMVLFFSKLDPAMEIDSLKTQIQLQKKEMNFLQSITNSAFSSCKMTVISFESTVHENGRHVLWQGDDALIGPFKVKKKGICIESIEAIGF